jgi:hypothetical protein
MFKKFIIGLTAIAMIAQPAYAGKFGGGGSFSSSRSSISSGSTSRSFSAGSSYRPSTNYSRPATPAAPTSPRFSAGSQFNTAKPAQTRVVPRQPYYRPAYSGYNRGYQPTPQVQNHYYGGNGGGGFGSSFAGAFGGSILGNMIFGGHQSQPVIVNNGGGYAPQAGVPVQGDPGYAQAGQVVNNGPGFFGMIFWGLVNLFTLIIIVAIVIWISRKLYRLAVGN